MKFQIAASNSQYGPFNFVGPDGTANTFFTTSGASLSQFDGMRYVKYKAFLSTNSSSVTPSLSSVSVCFNDTSSATATTLAVDPATGTFGGNDEPLRDAHEQRDARRERAGRVQTERDECRQHADELERCRGAPERQPDRHRRRLVSGRGRRLLRGRYWVRPVDRLRGR